MCGYVLCSHVCVCVCTCVALWRQPVLVTDMQELKLAFLRLIIIKIK